MLGLFPKPYPDELLYSVLARYYVRSGYANYVFAAEDLFQSRYVRPSFEYVSPLNEDVMTCLRKIDTIQNILLNHTMFPYHCRFLTKERKQNALNSLINMDSDYRHLILFPKRTATPSMCYCPLCAADDRKNYGETYWHRLHQIYELTVCPVHKCFLVNADYKLSGKLPPDLVPAEIVIPSSENIILCENEKILVLAEYIKEVFIMPIKMDSELAISDLLRMITEKSGYRTPRGEVCRISALYKDFEEFYMAVVENIPKQWQIHKIFTGQRYDFYEVILLGFFLNISANDFDGSTLSKNEKKAYEVFDDTIHSLRQLGYSFPKIAETMGYPVDIIKNAAYMNRNNTKDKKVLPQKEKVSKRHPGRREIDWDKMDNELLPKVVEIIENWKKNDKLKRITINAVSMELGLKSKQIDHLPQCLSLIKKFCQTQEEFWTEKVLWAWGKLSNEGRTISIKRIRLMTNMSTDQIRRCLPELAKLNRSIYENIVMLL